MNFSWLRNKKAVAITILFLIATTITTSILFANYNDQNFPTVTYTPSPGFQEYHPTEIFPLNIPIIEYPGYEIDTWELTKNNTINKGQLGSYNSQTKQIEIPAINGDPVNLTGLRKSNMYHAIWRDSSGRTWRTGVDGQSYIFTADPSTISGGISQYPGLFPVKDDSGTTIPAKLRYIDGSAAAWSDTLPPPVAFQDPNGDDVNVQYIQPSSIKITSAKAVQSNLGIVYDYVGKGQDGNGYIKLHKPMTAGHNIPDLDYVVEPYSNGNVQGRTYNFISDTEWSGISYKLTYKLKVTYKKINADKPDLVALDIVSNSGIKIGTAASFTATFKNTGLKVTAPFNVKVMQGSTVVILKSIPSIDVGQTISIPFNYTFTLAGSKTFTMYVDSSNSIVEESEQNNEVSKVFSPGDAPPAAFTGDFDVVPDTIEYRQSFTLHPRDFQLDRCTYISHQYKIERGGTYISPWYTSQSDTTFTSANYPWNIGVGSHLVSMKIKTTCGESNWIGPKYLTVTSPSTNTPPQFKIGFVNPNDRTKPLNEVVQGAVLDLIYIDDPSVPTPYDADGDSLYFMGFDFEKGNNFIKGIPSQAQEYGDGWHHVTMNTAGWHNVTGMMRDEWGASATASTYINVVPPNPIAIPTCPAPVVENHPVPQHEFLSIQSRSPMGRTIDHTKDEWINKRTSYVNGTDQNIKVVVQLHVYDSEGLKSLEPGTCEITVKPDLPPKAKLTVPPIGIREQSISVINNSTSPDGDAITRAEYQYKYDDENNGFADDQWQALSGTLAKANFKPSKVGKYLFYLKATEEYGKFDDTLDEAESTLTLDVVNNAPEVSFELEGKNPQPDLDPFTTVTASQMFNWPLYVPNELNQVKNKQQLWKVQNGKLVSGEGRNFGSQTTPVHWWEQTRFSENKQSIESFAMSNNGYGNNRLSPWRSTTSSTVSVPMLDEDDNKISFNNYLMDFKFKIRSNKKLVYFSEPGFNDKDSQMKIYAVDPKKLSPVEMYFKPYAMYANYRYTGGSPYAFILKKPTYRYINGEYASPQFVESWDLGERYIYVKRSWQTSTFLVELAVHDAFTGQLIKSSLDTNFNIPDGINSYKLLYTKGENLVLINNYDHSQGYTAPRIVEVTPDLQIVRNVLLSRPSLGPDASTLNGYNGTKEYHFGDFTPDATGAMYNYQFYYPTSSGWGGTNQFDLNVTKYNPDYTVAWRKYLKRDTTPIYKYFTGLFMSGFTYSDDYNDVVYNHATNEVYAKYYYNYYKPGDVIPTGAAALAVLDGNNGNLKAIKNSTDPDFNQFFYTNSSWADMGKSEYSFNWGDRSLGPNSTVTAEGNRTTMENPSCPGELTGSNKILDPWGNNVGSAGVPCNSGHQVFGEYFGDGVYVSMNSPYSYSGSTSQANLNISYGPPTTSPKLVKSFTQGQFYSSDTLSNAEIRFGINMLEVNYDQEYLGMSFRMQDPRNRYAVETNGNSLQIVKYINGNRTVLANGSYPMQDQTDYLFRLKFVGDKIDLWMNSIPILSATDSSFTDGKFGYFADKSFVTLSPIRYKVVQENISWSDQYAIWDGAQAKAEVQYKNISFIDPENDPVAGSYQWSLKHTVRFINNQGLSALDGKTFSSPQLTFDKVGDYLVTLRAKDDPNPSYLTPSMVFDSYRKTSNEFVKKVTVHRRPIADFTLTQEANGKITWTDYSRDPDRYENNSYYSNEPTGIDYLATRGIMERMYYYITPSGNYVSGKLTGPQEIGTYEVGMAVKDEYGALSDWTVKTITSGRLGPPNNPPVPGFTTTHTNTYRGVPVTFNSTAHDQEDGARENLQHMYFIKNVLDGVETPVSTSRTNWVKTFGSLGTFNIRQVVTDSDGATASYQLQVSINNRLPFTDVTEPPTTDSSNPKRYYVLRPNFRWSYSDPDTDAQSKFQVRIYRYGGVLQLDSGEVSGSITNWTPNSDLPEKVNMYIQVRAYDGYDWGPWSSAKYFYINTNTPPFGDFKIYTYDANNPAMPIYESDTVNIASVGVGDGENDTLSVRYEVKDPSNVKIVDQNYTFNPPYPNTGPSFKVITPGLYTVTQTISDGQAAPVVKTKTFQVNPLGIAAEVKHTSDWERKRLEYNLSVDPDRPVSWFWAGEQFDLLSDLTDTTTSWTKATRVSVNFAAKSLNQDLTSTDKLKWSGSMWQPNFKDIPDGNYNFIFTSYWSNGAVKQTTVTIKIAGNVFDVIRTHLLQ
ncbi:CARDB domain-containing protein [Paenibacillus gansuensis]|uniref:CARDB domain-containing protein n=1 Tax=Paenibacillus gansuensis TaxID=306542 RepID=A0ABW5PHG1_9BACL